MWLPDNYMRSVQHYMKGVIYMKCNDIIDHIEKFCPTEMAEDWDNVGLLVGDYSKDIKKVLVALDAIDRVIDEAIENGIDMIVTHHPLFNPKWNQIRNITTDETLGRAIHKLIKNDICLYSAHTNLDMAKGGINYILAGLIELTDIDVLEVHSDEGADEKYGIGKVGQLKEEITLSQLAIRVKQMLNLDFVRIIGDGNKGVKKVALCSGSGMSLMKSVLKNKVDVFLTGDVKYHDAQTALDSGMCIIDAGHYGTENIIIPVLKDYLSKLNGIQVIESKVNGEPFKVI